MRKAVQSIMGSFAVGCMIFMVSILIAYWDGQMQIFEQMQDRYDQYVLGIFMVSIVTGGGGYIIYRLNISYNKRVLLHYGATILTVMAISIWLDIISISVSQLLTYGTFTSVIFIVNWYVHYVNAKKDAEEINALLKQKVH
ncbi:DUF3021 family protein [Solibacillus sp. MA9]|uniref:DUF3021 family protein n=1 Tax=Solibacillus palustris TaxID=2908203 RepID=A0ABS9UB93_9BACL|nr:DUF3021 family protein [Solibacillus sp. MA9]MCH7321444.1 DUF3021 family protein [Solibacillus sp. MA9]